MKDQEQPNGKVVHILYSGLGGHGADFFSRIDLHNHGEFEFIPFFFGIEATNPDYEERSRVNNLRYYSFKKKPGLDLMVGVKVIKALYKTKPDIVCSYGANSLFPVFLYKIFNRNFRVIIRDTQAAHLKTWKNWMMLMIASLFSSKIVFLTEDAKKSLSSKMRFFFSEKKAVIIANGINLNLYNKSALPIKSGTIIFGMQSRLQKIKDHPTLLKAFALLLKKYPDLKVELRIAGGGDTLQSLINLTARLGITEHVVFCGMLTEHELIKYMKQLDFYVHATFGETMSNSILQAMSCGLPIVASDVSGVNNLLIDKLTGLLYESENEIQLFEKMERVVFDRNLASILAINALKEIKLKYAAEITYRKYKKLFDEALNTI